MSRGSHYLATAVSTAAIPNIVRNAGEGASKRFIEFFTANIRNANTRAAYVHAITQFFRWCEHHQISLSDVEPIAVATYVEQLAGVRSAPTVKQHLAAIKMLMDWLVIGQIIRMNPASSVRGPKHVVKKGKTPVLTADEASDLIKAIETDTLVGLRDRALIGVMVYSLARVSAVVGMNVEDYYQNGKRCWFRLHEKGGKFHEVPAHHTAETYLDAYVAAAGIVGEKKLPLFRTANGKGGTLTTNRMQRGDVLRMVKKRAAKVELSSRICCHSWRATGITTYLKNGGTLEHAQTIAAHESPRTTKLYDRTHDDISLDEIERIIL